MTYAPLVFHYDLINTVQAQDTQTGAPLRGTVRPRSSIITLPWFTDKESLKVTVNGIPSLDFTFREPNNLELGLVFDIDSLPVNIVVSRDTQTAVFPCEFTPGSAIRAQDLNANFQYLLELIKEAKSQ